MIYKRSGLIELSMLIGEFFPVLTTLDMAGPGEMFIPKVTQS